MSRYAAQIVPARASRHRAFGFTLLELLTALTVAGIVLAVGVPSYQAMVRNNRAAANANEFVSALSIARSEAVRRSDRVSICPSTDPEAAAAAGACDLDATWEDGWIVFVDGAASDDADPPIVVQVLGTWAAPAGETSVVTRSHDDAVDIPWIRFLSRGDTRTTEPLPITYGMEIDDCIGDVARDIEVNTVGRTSVTRVACS